VEERIPEKVYVAGLVKQAGAYDIPKDEPLRVTQAIAKAGGRTLELADTVYVSRYIPDQDEKVVIEVSLAAADADTEADLVLAPNDVVTVKETPLTFFVETMRNFFRFGFSSAIPGT
jgi:protein involved in polysaccharide export with SLBB domain